jgi:general secretion pathway protein B
MSFILDALRKSENERQKNQPLGVASPQGADKRRSSGIWLPLVALLVGVNLSLLLVMWITSDDQPEAPAVQAPAAIRDAEPINSQRQPVAAPATQPATMPESISGAVPESPPEAAPILAGGEENLPTMEELILDNRIAIQQLHLDIHVYSDDPAERFVFINMARYNEGQTLKEGPVLLAINPAGVVLRHQGYDFLVTRE